MIELWNIFYTFSPENDPQIEVCESQDKKIKDKSTEKNLSSFCFLGSGIKLELNEKMSIKGCLVMEIHFANNIIDELNNDFIILNLTDNNNYKINFLDLKKKTKKEEFPTKLCISIIQNIINISASYSDKSKQNFEFPQEYNPFEEIIFLENFIGQIEKFLITTYDYNSGMGYDSIIYPYFLNGNSIYFNNKLIKGISFTNPNLARVNYINYLDYNFDLENYFLGVEQLIPFVPLFDGIYKNQNIKYINGIDKKTILAESFRKIFFNFISIILEKKIGKKRLHLIQIMLLIWIKCFIIVII